jgi:hypothetical protein
MNIDMSDTQKSATRRPVRHTSERAASDVGNWDLLEKLGVDVRNLCRVLGLAVAGRDAENTDTVGS